MNRNSLLFLLILLSSVPLHAQITRKVLFLGNSYTSSNNLPQLVQNMAQSTGNTLNFDIHAPGGYTWEHHTLDNTSINKINVGDWDYVSLQGQSLEPIIGAQYFIQAGAVLRDLIYQANPCTVPLFYMTWGRENGDTVFCGDFPAVCTYESMDDALRQRYEARADVYNAELSPVSVVWRYLRDNHPGIDLYEVDGSHPTAAGSYAAACSFYTAIFKQDPTLITFDFSLSSADAATIRNATKTVVYDDMDSWDYKVLPNSNFSYSIGSGFNEVDFLGPGFGAIQDHSWNFGDGGTSTAFNPSHSYASNGTYTVQHTTSNCDVDGFHTSTTDTVIQFCDHTPTILTSKPWLCNYDTLWTQSADALQWFVQGLPIPVTDSMLPNYKQHMNAGAAFSVMATENGCSELSEPYVASPDWPGFYYDAAWAGDPCAGDTGVLMVLHFNGFLPPNALVRWYLNDSLLASENDEDTIQIWQGGEYRAMAVDPDSDCPKDSVFFSILFDCGTDTTIINDTTDTVVVVDTLDTIAGSPRLMMDHQERLLLYPNPATNVLTIACPGICNTENIEVLDAMGRLVESIRLESSVTLDVSDWPDGMYVLVRPRSGQAQRFFKQ